MLKTVCKNYFYYYENVYIYLLCSTNNSSGKLPMISQKGLTFELNSKFLCVQYNKNDKVNTKVIYFVAFNIFTLQQRALRLTHMPQTMFITRWTQFLPNTSIFHSDSTHFNQTTCIYTPLMTSVMESIA